MLLMVQVNAKLWHLLASLIVLDKLRLRSHFSNSRGKPEDI